MKRVAAATVLAATLLITGCHQSISGGITESGVRTDGRGTTYDLRVVDHGGGDHSVHVPYIVYRRCQPGDVYPACAGRP